MASTIITKNSSTASAVPVVGDLTKGELAVNVTDKKIYTKDNSAAVVKLVGSLGNQEANAVAITGGSIAGITDLAVADGGTGASTASDARTNLGLGTIATQAASSVTITGGSVTGITDITVADGGTGASTAANARTNLGAAASGANSDITSLSGLTTALSVAQGGTGITSFGSGVATFLGTPSSANLLAAVTDETGTGALVFANTPTFVAPILGTPTSGNFSSGSFTWPTFNQNTTGTAAGLSATLAIASGGTGQTTANAAFNALAPSQTSASGKYLKSDGTNTSWDALDISTADITGTLPVANGGTGVTSSTGTGSVVLSNSPTLVTPILGTPQSGNFSTGTFTWPTFNQNTTGTAAGLSATLATTSGGTGLTSFTSGGVVYASSTSALATGSALSFNGTNLTIGSGGKLLYSGVAYGVGIDPDGAGGFGAGYNFETNGGTPRYLVTGPISGQYLSSGSAPFVAWYLGSSAASGTAAPEQMRLTSTSLYTASGINVGIGLSNPTIGLTVEKDNGAGYIAAFRSGAGNPYITLQTTGSITQIQGVNSAFTDVNNIAMQISGGNVGIGTNSPDLKLTVSGAMNLRNSSRAGAFEIDSSGNLWMGTATTAGNLIFETGHSSAGLPSTGTERVKINQYGIGLGGATPSSGTGITFPATQSASSDANTLDDYEEGTWEPTLNFNGGTTGITYDTIRVGRYTKIGRIVTVSFSIILTSKGSSTGNANISGLPFASFNNGGANPAYAGTVVGEGNMTLMPTGTYCMPWSDSSLYLRVNGAASFSPITNTNFTNTSAIYGSVTYEVT